MILGIDFGTTNTGAALYDGKRLRLLPLDAASQSPEIFRSAIYMTRSGEYFLGSRGINTYFEQNIGRPTRFRKVRVGEIIQVFAELPTFYRDVYIYEDEFSPGRLFTSIKTALRSRDYYGTVFRGNWYSASDLVAIFLIGVKMQAEAQVGASLDSVVIGRPVHFSSNPDEDQVAQSRLLDAAFKAGFNQVYLEYEPVAAALSYARELHTRETILVFDFGGGTLDFTIMQIGGEQQASDAVNQRVLATGGVPIAGDIFDQRLFRAAIPRHLGEGDEYLSNAERRPIPAHIFDTLAQPAEILSLNTPQNLEMLRRIHAGALHPEKTHALLQVVSSNYALMIFDRVEQSKRRLSQEYIAELRIEAADFTISERLTRLRFERAIASEVEQIQAELLETLQRAHLKPDQIDRVIRTGGSSQIPLFVNMLNELFGVEKVQAINIFSSVTSGLAIRGHQIATGATELICYRAESTLRSREQAANRDDEQGTPPVSLELVQKRLQVQQEYFHDPGHLPNQVLLVLSGDGLFAAAADHLNSAAQGSDSLLLSLPEPVGTLLPGAQFLMAGLDDYILLATNQLKLISLTLRDLYLAQQAAWDGIVQSLPLEADEFISAMMSWNPVGPGDCQVCMLTTSGQGRIFDAQLLGQALKHRPFFQLERSYTGFPARLVSAYPGDTILAGSESGWIGMAQGSEIAVQAGDLLRLRKTERLCAASAVPAGALVGVISRDGLVQVVNAAEKLDNQSSFRLQHGYSIIGFLPLVGDLPGEFSVVSSKKRLYRISPGRVSEHLSLNKKPLQVINLELDEILLGPLL